MNRALWLLSIVNLLNFIDRYIIASAAPKIEAEFGLSHTQTGMLMSAFMVGYMLTSPVFGVLGDKLKRPHLMAVGVVSWSLATIASGFANAFLPLLLTRIAVGVGEASYATISPAYIRDRLPDQSRINHAMGIFYTAIPLGAALGYIFGGWMAEHYSWRYAFYLGGIPGLLLGVLVARLSEVSHREDSDHIVTDRAQLTMVLKTLWTNREYRLNVFGYIAYTFGLGGFAAWAPHYGVKVIQVSLAESSFKIGAVTCVAGIIGTLIGGKWGNIFAPAGVDSGVRHSRALMRFSAITSLIATPLAFWSLQVSSMNVFILTMLLVQIALFAASAPINTAVLSAVPKNMAATAFAVQIFAIHALGDLISPPLVGLLADHFSMSLSMSVLAGAIGLSAIVWWRGALES